MLTNYSLLDLLWISNSSEMHMIMGIMGNNEKLYPLLHNFITLGSKDVSLSRAALSMNLTMMLLTWNSVIQFLAIDVTIHLGITHGTPVPSLKHEKVCMLLCIKVRQNIGIVLKICMCEQLSYVQYCLNCVFSFNLLVHSQCTVIWTRANIYIIVR